MQVNQKEEFIRDIEFYLESEFIIKDKILSKICSRGFETIVKTKDSSLNIIFKNDDILLEIKLNKESLEYRMDLIHSKPKQDIKFIYCTYDEVKIRKDFKKYTYQLREDMDRLINNVQFYKHKENKDSFISENEYKYSKEYEIPKKDRYMDFMNDFM